MREIPDITDIYSNFLNIKNEQNVEERYSDESKKKYFHASSAGMCARKHWYMTTDEEKSNIADEKSQRVMRLGTVIHEEIQSSLQYLIDLKEKESNKEKEISDNSLNSTNIKTYNKALLKHYNSIEKIHMEKEIILEDYNVRGFYDVVFQMVSGEVYLFDIKSIGSYPYKLKFGRNPKEDDGNDHQAMQLGTYGIGVEREFGRLDGMFLYYYNKDTSMVKLKPIGMNYMTKAEIYWKQLNTRLRGGQPPIVDGISPAQKWECNYCSFKDTCLN